MILYPNKHKFVDDARSRIPDFDEELISRAWDFARQAYTNRQQKSKKQEDQQGNREIDSSRPFGVAHNLLAIDCDSATVAAALLYDLVRNKMMTIKEIKKRFGADVANLVEGVARLAPLDMLPDRAWMQRDIRRESLRKFFVAIVDDPRVALIKLADRLYKLATFEFPSEERKRKIESLSEERKHNIAQESLDVFAPLAEALELGTFQSRIQELAFRYLEPDAYRELEQKLREKWEECKKIRDSVVRSLEDELAKTGINASVYDRKKEIYSIYQKMQSYKLSFDEVYDIIGIRIIVDTLQDCYKAKEIVDKLGTEVKYDDWIHTPRGQGRYQSLHKVMRGTGGVLFEIQIRSQEMHLQAERGTAAHWIYKLGEKSLPPDFIKKINILRETLEKTLGAADKDASISTEDIAEYSLKEGIHVFTPNGDVILLPQGSTPLDFAYRIHTTVGHEYRGAWVSHGTWNNRKYVPLDYELEDGDIVEIDRRKGATPRRSWITEGRARSPQAQQRIRQYFLAQERAEMIAGARNQVQEQLSLLSDLQVGIRDILSAFIQARLLSEQTDEEGLYLALAESKISAARLQRTIGELAVKRCLTDEGLSKEFIRDLVKWFADRDKLPFNREDGLFLAVVKQEIPLKLLHKAVHELATSPSVLPPINVGTASISTEDNSVERNLSFHTAQCCCPLPNDEIIGFVTVGHGLSLHRYSCPQVHALLKHKAVVPITWKDLSISEKRTFCSKVLVTLAWYDQKVFRKILDLVLKVDGTIREETAIGFSSQVRFIVSLKVKDLNSLQDIQDRFRQIEGVTEVCRQEQLRSAINATGVGRSAGQ